MATTFLDITDRDFDELKRIYDWYIAHSTATFHTEPISVEQLREFIYVGHPLYKSFLIYDDNAIAGYAILTNHKKRQAYDRTAEVTIYLKPEFTGKGLGRAALAYLEKVARTTPIKNLVGVISGDNLGSIALFEKAGYVKCAHFKNVGEKFNKVLDVVAYQKEL